MRTYFKVTLLYVMAAWLLLILLHGSATRTLAVPLQLAGVYAGLIIESAALLLLLVVPLIWKFQHRSSFEHLSLVFLVAMSSILFQVGFLLFKSAIPQIVPFYADPFWAMLDKAMLFGYDAWELSHAVTPGVLVAWFPLFYATIWFALAFAFPIVVVASDPDEKRVARYAWLFFLSWIVTGNIIALLGSSVGPIYYDRLLGTDRFAELHMALAASGFSAGPIGQGQETLWANLGGLLSSISAFPSVHVAVACIVALYVRERFRRFRWVADAYLALILLISVYSGYHYLLDGVASIAIVLALNAALAWKAKGRPSATTASVASNGSPTSGIKGVL